jgi:hypothetical protein
VIPCGHPDADLMDGHGRAGCRSPYGTLGRPDPRRPTSQGRDNRRSGVLGGQSQFAARPLGWSDLKRLLEQAGAPAPCKISIPKPVLWDTRRARCVAVCRFRQIAQVGPYWKRTSLGLWSLFILSDPPYSQVVSMEWRTVTVELLGITHLMEVQA